MPQEGVSSMLQGKLMPHIPTILASIISITFISLWDLPRHWMYSTFRVRRQVVFEVL
jgi:hypothetical protein